MNVNISTEQEIHVEGQSSLVSVLLLSMNHEAYIERSIISLRNQVYKNIEIIYLDNASKDGTYTKGVRLLAEGNIPYKCFKNEISAGISSNLNFLVDHADGEYICLLSSDDWLTPESIQEKIDILQTEPTCGMVHSLLYRYDNENKQTRPYKSKVPSNCQWTLNEVLNDNGITGVGCLIRKSILYLVGKWDENSPIEDWDLWIRIAETSRIRIIPKYLGFHRINHGGNISQKGDYMYKGRQYIINKYNYHHFTSPIKDEHDYKLYFLATNEPNLKALDYLFKNFKFNVFYLRQLIKILVGMQKSGLRKIHKQFVFLKSE